ncbi:hypothetical protein Landi51_04632 [Colletotrichum acutatum]
MLAWAESGPFASGNTRQIVNGTLLGRNQAECAPHESGLREDKARNVAVNFQGVETSGVEVHKSPNLSKLCMGDGPKEWNEMVDEDTRETHTQADKSLRD